MSYIRVLPRDLFNEASLLKCYGALWIALDSWHAHSAKWSTEDLDIFDIQQRAEDGAIYLDNLTLDVEPHSYQLTRPLNSRCNWPLYAERVDDPDFEPIAVFSETNGTLTEEFRALVK